MSDVAQPVAENTPSIPAVEPVAAVAPLLAGLDAPKAEEAPAPEAVETKADDTPKPDDKPADVVYALKAPDGGEIDPAIADAYAPVAKELGLTNEGAQKLIDKIGPVVDARMAQMQTEMLTEFTKQNVAACVADKEFGGDDIVKNVAIAEKALTTFGTPALRELLDKTKLSNHPEIIRLFYRAGKAISEDTFVAGGLRPEGSETKSHGEKLYGKK